MRTCTSILFLLFTVSGIAQIGTKTQQSKIHGIWQNNSFGYQMTLMLNPDGTGEFDGDAIKYTANDGKFVMTVVAESQTTHYSYSLQGNTLTVSGGDLDAPVAFTRSGTSAQTKVAPSIQPTGQGTDQSLIGTWSGNGESIEFTTNGQCNYLGQTYPYQLSAGHVTLQTAQGNFMLAYSVQGNSLSLTGNGQTVQYTKGNAGGSRSNTQAQTGGRRIAQELVGKWCYVNVTSTYSGGSSSEECITLNADGTYEYYSESSRSVNTNAYAGGTNSQGSDRGSWSYDGSRIYYTSSAGAGSGSYALEKRNHPKNNDPMIVLDGKTYATQYQKAPWR